MPETNNPMILHEGTININEYTKLVRKLAGANMAFRALKKMQKQGYMSSEDVDMILLEFGADFE